ncbi:DUF2062 domain-containing protein [Prochlorococcus marinus]|uniref:DUF2062 domain-containing protein n=1 Tax=Prochlorococcus marinus XMU1408 TaxID=2213228 RepID=A0A318R848_PROMR|nr:DUF2062 domain-containing protein [Prochlorococcus marinus]MBW3041251.1 DUF2062 domain-containing protein [Prochlorococcus marinus str. XMU1408]PYE03840.1 DUF2062 domain-containing protein [Prochlorococcus marinus XMU1408]
MRKIFLNLIKRIRKFISWLWNQEGSPSQRALGFGVGIFSGCFPFFGLQTLMGVFLAKILKGNTILAAVGTWISNPFTYLPLYYFNFRIGSLLFNSDKEVVDYSLITNNNLWSQSWYLSSRLIIGSICVGLVTGIIGGLCLYLPLKKLSNTI